MCLISSRFRPFRWHCAIVQADVGGIVGTSVFGISGVGAPVGRSVGVGAIVGTGVGGTAAVSVNGRLAVAVAPLSAVTVTVMVTDRDAPVIWDGNRKMQAGPVVSPSKRPAVLLH